MAFKPEKGPQNGVRRFFAANAAAISAQVTPGSTVTNISSSLISTILFSLDVSIVMDFGVVAK